MVLRKHNQTAGFSLIEVLVAITILGLVVVPIGSSLVLSFRLNAHSGDTLQAQLAVSSAVETIMAEGYSSASEANCEEQFGVKIDATAKRNADNSKTIYYDLTVSDAAALISVKTSVRPAKGGG